MNPKYNVPKHTLEGITNYVEHYLEPGGFLYAVFSNDLFGALARADHINKDKLQEICNYIYNECPSGCWGSEEHIKKWLSQRVP